MLYNVFMHDRHEKLLKAIVDIYMKTAEPVGSKILAETKDLEVSPATIRNDMAELEEAGYIWQPHTSAGRIPTLNGYQHYVDKLMEVKAASSADAKMISDLAKKDWRELAKFLVAKTNLAVIVGFAPNDLYYTGLFNLFSQPEFEDHRMVLSMSQVVDSLERAMHQVFYQVPSPKVLLGTQSPLGDNCALVATMKDQKLLSVLGPVRMDYGRVLGLFNEVVKVNK